MAEQPSGDNADSPPADDQTQEPQESTLPRDGGEQTGNEGFHKHPDWIKREEKQKAELAKRDQELDEMRQRMAVMSEAPNPAEDQGEAVKAAVDEIIKERFGDVVEATQRIRLEKELGISLSDNQVEAISKIASETGLSAQRALVLAQREAPDAFGGGRPGFDPAVHRSQVPDGGASPLRVPLPETNPISQLKPGATAHDKRQAARGFFRQLNEKRGRA